MIATTTRSLDEREARTVAAHGGRCPRGRCAPRRNPQQRSCPDATSCRRASVKCLPDGAGAFAGESWCADPAPLRHVCRAGHAAGARLRSATLQQRGVRAAGALPEDEPARRLSAPAPSAAVAARGRHRSRTTRPPGAAAARARDTRTPAFPAVMPAACEVLTAHPARRRARARPRTGLQVGGQPPHAAADRSRTSSARGRRRDLAGERLDARRASPRGGSDRRRRCAARGRTTRR